MDDFYYVDETLDEAAESLYNCWYRDCTIDQKLICLQILMDAVDWECEEII